MSDSPFPVGDPAALGFDPERLSRIGPAMQAFVDDGRVPNLVTLVARGGQIVHQHACGVLDLDEDAPAGLDSLFRMYSNTKPIAGAATMVLYERGVLTPDDSIGRFLPEWRNLQVRRADEPMMTERARRGITIRDCLTNTTGLSNPGTMPHFYRQQYRDTLTKLGWIRGSDGDDAPRPNNRERIRALAELPLAAHPGEQFGYHVGYPVLTAVLEEASGQPLDVFFREAIFEPLGMKDTDFYVDADDVRRFGANYHAPRGRRRDATGRRRQGGHEREGRRAQDRVLRRGRHGGRVVHRRRLRALRPDALERRRIGRSADPRP